MQNAGFLTGFRFSLDFLNLIRYYSLTSLSLIHILAPTAMGELVDSIAEYNNSANAIGFSVYYYIDQMYSKPGLRLLAVDGLSLIHI